MKNFRTFNLAVEFYKQIACQKLPGTLKIQLTRAASSIALNLAEGRERQTIKDQMRFFNISLASLRECQAILILANLENSNHWYKLDCLAAHLYKLIKSCR